MTKDTTATCIEKWPATQTECNKFVIAVASRHGVTLSGNADAILAAIRKAPWTSHDRDGVAASKAASEGRLVVAGLTAAELGDPSHGHVVVVVKPTGDLAHGKYPYAYWGSQNVVIRPDGGKGKTLNYSFGSGVRDKIFYASIEI